MNKMLAEAKTIRNIEPKHFFLVLKRIENETIKDEEISDDNFTSSEQNQQNILAQSDNVSSSQNYNNKEKNEIKKTHEFFIKNFDYFYVFFNILERKFRRNHKKKGNKRRKIIMERREIPKMKRKKLRRKKLR